jgi:peptidoglycan/xylan/chitin deacetylase (PgdA/CDA1 family)
LALEKIIAQENRISLIIDRNERHFSVKTLTDKNVTFAFLANWLRQLPPAELASAIHDLCKRYTVDIAALTREAMIDWADLTRLAEDPLVTIGSSTVNHAVLSSLKNPDALREMTMGKAVAETAFQRDVRHFAFPFGDRDAFNRGHVVMAKETGFSSAASTIPGIVDTAGRTNLYALPRIAWDGRITSLRAMRVLLSGATFTAVRPTRKPDI